MGAVSYSVHPSIEYARNCVRALEKRSGMSLDDWIEKARSGPEGEEHRRQWLKEEHGLGTNFAWWITERSYGRGEEDTDENAYLRRAPEYVEAMYDGPKSLLRPIYDRLIESALELGPDVKVCPCQTIVPLYRNHVFAQIKPTTTKRIDLGFSLRGVEPAGRLLSMFGKGKTATVEVDAQDREVWVRGNGRWLLNRSSSMPGGKFLVNGRPFGPPGG